MRIIGRFLCVAAFAFSPCAWADDPIYYFAEGPYDGGYGYAWVPSFEDLSKAGYSFYPIEDMSEYWDNAPDCYLPYSSDPAYASYTPSGPPSGGGSGGSFDVSLTLGGLGDLISGLGFGVGSLALACVGIVSGFLVYRKFIVSVKRV